ncbi:ATP-binding protein [Acidaminobacter hydrogenoformans]|uniref:ATPase family associated with various cellular activities (AAA) n=1 Tax=Acidaminobacter hydrogenoformans DSM 2784 TaxID=1120920 RepID=A0A1G5S293_9FIRM|nr:ATP-binding protein [Acidaminobacter hydrogenoformans]SCZ79689.1 ATPase family associated with various cellular activities (AAA) [Acidaminobacter hydrogenoformans DSM 2784]
MNIKDAKTQVKNAVFAYLSKDEFDDYKIPIEKQRPIFLYGVPGIGKTAIMEQVAQELNLGLVSYSMTHHTRQSALGLPFISRKTYGGVEVDVSEYTMSEIIASIYDTMEASGVREGILFLDELNCVSETLAPAMLQFLQFKIFGRHKVPDGWIIVTAGNPPEYNKSVREFDIVTMDRIKKIDVEPNLKVWKEYAYQQQVHGAILSYLELKNHNFYSVETTIDGKAFVTARGWEDLSKMIQLYEGAGIPVDENLIIQYLQNDKIAKDFAVYYDLYNKYKSDYQIREILEGTASETLLERAAAARFDERLSLLGLLIDAVTVEMRDAVQAEMVVSELVKLLKDIKHQLLGTLGTTASAVTRAQGKAAKLVEAVIQSQHQAIYKEKMTGAVSQERKAIHLKIIQALESYKARVALEGARSPEDEFAAIKAGFDQDVSGLKARVTEVQSNLDHMFAFVDEAYGAGNEILILVTELTANCHSARFIGQFGCDAYFKHNKALLFYERQQDIVQRIEALDADIGR